MPFHSLFVGLSLPSSFPSRHLIPRLVRLRLRHFILLSLSPLFSYYWFIWGASYFLFDSLAHYYTCVSESGSGSWKHVFVFFKTGFFKTIIIITVKREKVFHINIFVYGNNNNNSSSGGKKRNEKGIWK